jgi:hypothetical protein
VLALGHAALVLGVRSFGVVALPRSALGGKDRRVPLAAPLSYRLGALGPAVSLAVMPGWSSSHSAMSRRRISAKTALISSSVPRPRVGFLLIALLFLVHSQNFPMAMPAPRRPAAAVTAPRGLG